MNKKYRKGEDACIYDNLNITPIEDKIVGAFEMYDEGQNSHVILEQYDPSSWDYTH